MVATATYCHNCGTAMSAAPAARPPASRPAPVRRTARDAADQTEEERPRFVRRARPVFAIVILTIGSLFCFLGAAGNLQQVDLLDKQIRERDAAGIEYPLGRDVWLARLDQQRTSAITTAIMGVILGIGAMMTSRNPRGATLTCALLFSPIPILLLVAGLVALNLDTPPEFPRGELQIAGSALTVVAIVMLLGLWGAVYDGFRVAKLRRLAAQSRSGSRGIKGGRGLRGVY